MPRLKGAARDEDWSIMDIYNLGLEIQALGNEAWSIFVDYGTWKFGDHRPENQDSQLVAARSRVRFKIKQYLGSRRDHIRRQLYLLKYWS